MAFIKAWRIKAWHIVFILVMAGLLYKSWVSVTDVLQKRSIQALSTVLAGRLVVVDPGHGGIDTGARSNSGTLEKDINLEVSKKLGAMLGQAGAAVILTREFDTWLADPEAPHKKRSDLTKRVDLANTNKADAFISIHVNSFPYDRSQRGAQTFSQPGSGEGRILSGYIQKELSRVLNTKRGPKEVDYFIRNCKVPSVIVEIGFLSNPAEEKLLTDPSYQSKTAFAIYCGLVRYLADRDMRGLQPE